jgi:DNA repair exonuclease SbcCD ATPase subunit
MSTALATRKITQREWDGLSVTVKRDAERIAISIRDAQTKIESAKEKAENAPNVKGGFLGLKKNIRRTQALSEAQIMQSEASTEILSVVQESIKFTCTSLITARDMQKALAWLAMNGIRDANGRVEMLGEECEEQISSIIDAAEDFVQKQQRVEDNQARLNQELENKKHEDRARDKQLEELAQNNAQQKKDSDAHKKRLENELKKQTDANRQLEKKMKQQMSLNKQLEEELEKAKSAVRDNSKRIDINENSIADNNLRIQQNTAMIADNKECIERNSQRIEELIEIVERFDEREKSLSKKVVFVCVISGIGTLTGVVSLLLTFLS